MKNLVCLVSFCLLSFGSLRLAAQEKAVVFEIGRADGDYREFAIAGNYGAYTQRFPRDVNFVVGRSDPAQDWAFILPGPTDTWAGGRPHAARVTFTLPAVAPGYYQLAIDFVSTHYASPPRLVLSINGTELKRRLPAGNNDAPLTDPKAGKKCALHQIIPASLLRAGTNSITLLNAEGSWALFDSLRLESGVAAPPEPIRAELQALPWYKRTPEGPQRAVKVSVQNLAGGTRSADLAWKAGTHSGSRKCDLQFGENELFLTVPDVQQPTPLELTVTSAGATVKQTTTIAPARKWRVYIVPTVHTDIGYTDLQERVMARHASNTVHALEMAAKSASFNWDFETFWQLDCFLRAHPERTDEVFERLRSGRMGLSAFFGNLLTGLCSHEALNRSTLAARNLANQGRFEFKSVILDDVPSAVGSLPTILAQSGIKYFIEGVNGDRAPHATHGLPNPFYWEGPDGSRVLSHIAGGYAMAGGLISSVERAAEQLPAYLASRDTADYPYDAVLVNGAFGDNQGVAPWVPEVVERWNAEWEFPKLILGPPQEFFEYIEKNFADKIPVLKTDFGAWWEDGAASSALETALCRRAEERAVTAEMLHSIAAVLAGAKYPKAGLDELWRNILLYDEHTWGAWCSISAPKNEQTVKQWQVKASFAHQADKDSRELLERGLQKLAALTPASDLVVFNPLSWTRTEVVRTENADAVTDLASQRTVPCQALPEGGSCFVASGLPSVGYRTYRRAPAVLSAKPAARISGNVIENEFYRVTLDPTTGALKSILDKETARELVDAQSEYGLGEVIYVSGGEGSYAVHSDLNRLPAPKFNYHRQTATRLESINGPVFGELTSHAKAEKLPHITLRVRLYHDVKRLDLSYELDKEETTAKEAVYVAFPFALDVEPGGLWLEYPDAIAQPLKDQHATACRDWYAVQRWLAASDGQATVVLSPLDTPLVTLGGMTGSTWPRRLSLQRAHVFAYVMNNYWHTNYKAQQGGRHQFRFSLTSNRGAFSSHAAVQRGWEMFCPPVAHRGSSKAGTALFAPSMSLVSVEPAALPLLAFKQAEDQQGFVFRLCDFAGLGGEANLRLPKPAIEVLSCNLVETDAQKTPAQGQSISVPVKRFSPVTFKARFAR